MAGRCANGRSLQGDRRTKEGKVAGQALRLHLELLQQPSLGGHAAEAAVGRRGTKGVRMRRVAEGDHVQKK